MRITGKTPISDVIESHDGAAEILLEYGLMCVGCAMSNKHCLEDIKDLYGFKDKDVEEIIKRVNDLKENEDK